MADAIRLVSSSLQETEPTGKSRQPDDPKKVLDAAKQFEALLVSQMMKSTREASAGGWSGNSDDHAGDSMMDMAEQQISKVLTAGSGLGLAKMVVQGLSQPQGIKKTPS
jgi:Rod binding domain-containing protein